MHIVGIVGGVASGKSLVARFLSELGAAVLDGDRAGHEALRDPGIIEAIRDRWGDGVIQSDGQVVRSAVAKIVFAETPEAAEELRFLEDLTHPHIRDNLREQIERLAAQGKRVAVLDAPVLLKAGWNEFCNTLLFVNAPEDLRVQRTIERGWTQTELSRREAAQAELDEKRAAADAVLDNSGTPEELRQQIKDFWDSHLAAHMRK